MARRALELVPDQGLLGIGTGRAAFAFVRALAERVREGLRVRCVPTSTATEALAVQLGVPLATLAELGELDLDVDGADEVSPALDLVKGRGGALLREKIVASAARRLVILAQPEKQVPALGAHGILPVEVLPFGCSFCARRITALGLRPRLRLGQAEPYVTDNGNYILDCAVEPIADPAALQRQLEAIPGVLGTGLFLGMAETVFLEDEHGEVTTLRRPAAAPG